jgi:hypothetical protein
VASTVKITIVIDASRGRHNTQPKGLIACMRHSA